MLHGLLVAALRAEQLANSGRFSPAEPACQERVHISLTRSPDTRLCQGRLRLTSGDCHHVLPPGLIFRSPSQRFRVTFSLKHTGGCQRASSQRRKLVKAGFAIALAPAAKFFSGRKLLGERPSGSSQLVGFDVLRPYPDDLAAS